MAVSMPISMVVEVEVAVLLRLRTMQPQQRDLRPTV
jgi:hypothetical protein